MSETYLDKVLVGAALWTEIDDYVSEWHHGESDAELHDYLGLTWDEYSLWAEQPRALRLIIAARHRDRPVLDFVAKVDDYALAARGGLTEDEARTVREWLEQTGRLPKP